MKIVVFQSDKGDCLLLEGLDGSRVLVDGGMPDTYTAHVAPYLDNLRQTGGKLDVVYVSHIDEDHISGILQMMDDAVEWSIFDFQTDIAGNLNFKKPEALRPPPIDRVWHNAFHEQVEDNNGEIEDMLAATVAVLAGGDTQKFIRMAQFHQDAATSIRQAVNLSRRLGEKQLAIKLNPEAGGKLMMLRKTATGKPPAPIKVGGMKWHIIGPAKTDLEHLKVEWQKWLRENKQTIFRVQENSRRTERRLGNSLSTEINQIVGAAAAQSELLASDLLEKLDMSVEKKLGVRRNVTVPNLASLMFMVEEKDAGGKIKTVLLTGDGHHLDILKGLEMQKKIKSDGTLHFNVLKVQHHGSEHNIDREFCKKVIADHYIFCGNGAHKNPDLKVVEAIIDSRLTDEHKSSHPKADQPFKLWFNSSSENAATETENADHMKKVEDLVEEYRRKNQGKPDCFFLKDSKFEFAI